MDETIAQGRFFLHRLRYLANGIKDNLDTGNPQLAYDYATELLTVLSNRLGLAEAGMICDDVHGFINRLIQHTELYQTACLLQNRIYQYLNDNLNTSKTIIDSIKTAMSTICLYIERIRSLVYMLDFIYYMHQDNHAIASFTTLASLGALPIESIQRCKLIPSITYNCRGLSIFQPIPSVDVAISCLRGLYDFIEFIGFDNLSTLAASLFSNKDEYDQTISFYSLIDTLMTKKNDEQKQLLPNPLLLAVLTRKLSDYKQHICELEIEFSMSREDNLPPATSALP